MFGFRLPPPHPNSAIPASLRAKPPETISAGRFDKLKVPNLSRESSTQPYPQTLRE